MYRLTASSKQYLKDSCGQLEHRDVISDLCSNTSPTSIVYPNMSVLAKICHGLKDIFTVAKGQNSDLK